MPETIHIKGEARRLVDEIPETATWADFARLMLERRHVEEWIAEEL